MWILMPLSFSDQFCSLVFTLSNLFLFACVYAHGLDETWRKCGSSNSHWYLAFLLASLPLFVRLVQSIRRYADSKLVTHLINVCFLTPFSKFVDHEVVLRRVGNTRLGLFPISSFTYGDIKVRAFILFMKCDWLFFRKRPQRDLCFMVGLQHTIFGICDLLGACLIPATIPKTQLRRL